ncbi:NAD(P)H-binding protein [Cyanobium sp. Aljojuca 7D2]|uniref:SDR family oxidoreductase n=1 Tax=Cyanobium sp. Aljojuca 7D2 TaxID=2823698 RepID=UPI0020CBD11F|nr:NAD-dependent epimerase/dehydratase family protein [Cyanobium sp. Aljojuca 7D2]MCP9892077.1 NAD(P)H-binding protein [Cyanobium sp. Aljojuca 7D2]
MTIAVSGANGFTGRFVCAELQRRQLPFFALLRPGRDASWMAARQIPVRYADLNHSAQVCEQLSGCRALLNVASIGFGAAPVILEACRAAAVRRVVFVSTTAIFTQLNAGSKAVRQAAEAAITASGLGTTILRPTMIYGTPGDRNMIRLVRWLNRWPVLPVFGNGLSLQQPVHVADVAWAVVQALEIPAAINRQFNISGAAPLTYNEVVRLTAEALGRRVQRVHIPAQPVVAVLQAAERLGLILPLKAEQILRLNEDKAFSHADAAAAFGYAPIPFQQGIRQEIALFRSGEDGLSCR